ncbi:hypothetical protein DL766_006384 [Monosporascus sp. MC13-8B]|uniref:lytic cellulose monooxygenase (C4-dehydrogenating) n=1 Tax=Monosporascus cannonballus TaxID=155416 RepID=A0ABY0GXN0_9PEZI|nr:hypothetical protein DL762_009366 [Monosporascus cannonballus]RYO84797.1 hypothetical protein DL763_007362 [Monosporascus cannonballus]RYP27474.1 hypothetical protein DL766_006384 [Monosporascus sp. MC13-8B]
MKCSTAVLFSSTLLCPINAHYLFGRLILDGKWTKTWEYIREVSPAQGMDPSLAIVAPNTEPNSLDLRCGRNASISRSQLKTATVRAGDTGDRKPWVYHPGFASAWLSKSPIDDLHAYTGNGDWFKILAVTGRTEQSIDLSDPENNPYDPLKAIWGTYRVDSWNFTIPTKTPSGRYLLRFEHTFPNQIDAQFYVNLRPRGDREHQRRHRDSRAAG